MKCCATREWLTNANTANVVILVKVFQYFLQCLGLRSTRVGHAFFVSFYRQGHFGVGFYQSSGNPFFCTSLIFGSLPLPMFNWLRSHCRWRNCSTCAKLFAAVRDHSLSSPWFERGLVKSELSGMNQKKKAPRFLLHLKIWAAVRCMSLNHLICSHYSE